MRIVVGSFQQESNTLTSRVSTRDDFVIHRGAAMLDHIAVGDYFRSIGVQVVPTLYANAVPGGPLRRADFEQIAGALVDSIPDDRVDGVWLYLHGAMEVEEVGSGEAALMRAIRERVGPSTPVSIALDFHANNTHDLVALSNVIVGYRTAPHRDMRETELRAARLLVRCIDRGLLPRPQMVRADVVVPGDCVLTDQSPLREIMAHARDLERQVGMLVCNVFNGQPWVDAPNMGPSMVCVHEQDPTAARKAARSLARRFYEARHEFRFSVDALDPAEAIDFAMAAPIAPVFVSDSGDNTTAGSSGDSAHLLRILQAKPADRVLVAGITDAPAVHACLRHQIGDRIDTEVGGTIEPASPRTCISGTLVYTGDIEGWYGENAGACAVVRCDGIDVILTAGRVAVTKPRIIERLGLSIDSYHVVVVKLGYLFPELARLAATSVLALTRGGSTERLQDMGMKRIRRPMFPLDDDFEPSFG